jgi:hypothetical protein
MAMPEHTSSETGGYGSSPYMKAVAWSILVMGISLAIVIVLYLWFGYIGPSFSSSRQLEQQQELRAQYGLPPSHRYLRIYRGFQHQNQYLS